jgi:hypothetical protein
MQSANVVDILFNHPAFSVYNEFSISYRELKRGATSGFEIVCKKNCLVARGKIVGNFAVIPYVEVGIFSIDVLWVKELNKSNRRRIMGVEEICEFLNQNGPRGFKFNFVLTDDGILLFTVNEVGT